MNSNRMFFEKGPSLVCLLAKEDINLSLKILTMPQAEHHRYHQKNRAYAGEDKTKPPAWFWLGQVCSSQKVASVLLITLSKGNGKMIANELSFSLPPGAFLQRTDPLNL